MMLNSNTIKISLQCDILLINSFNIYGGPTVCQTLVVLRSTTVNEVLQYSIEGSYSHF